jgi:hypothetical protein
LHDASDVPTVEEDMLYLVFELERSVRMASPKLSPMLAANLQRRLEDLAETVRRLGTRQGS